MRAFDLHLKSIRVLKFHDICLSYILHESDLVPDNLNYVRTLCMKNSWNDDSYTFLIDRETSFSWYTIYLTCVFV